jgi:hypothetical protein
MSVNLGGFRTSLAPSELILQFFALSFCSLEKGERKKEKKNPMKQERLLSHWMAKWLLAVHST